MNLVTSATREPEKPRKPYSTNPRANTRDLPYASETPRNRFPPIRWTVGNDMSCQENLWDQGTNPHKSETCMTV